MTVLNNPAAIGIVLAGGAARRMQPAAAREPRAKEWMTIGGRSLLDRVVDVVAAETERTLVVAAPARPLPPVRHPVKIIHDSAPGSGPLAALLDGLGAVGAVRPEPLVFVTSCDVPLLKRDVVRLLIGRAAESRAEWTIPTVAGHPQVLCSVVRPSLADPIAAWLATGRRDPRGLLAALVAEDAMRVRLVAEPEISRVDPLLESFRDVDTPEALAEIEQELTYGERGTGSYTPPP